MSSGSHLRPKDWVLRSNNRVTHTPKVFTLGTWGMGTGVLQRVNTTHHLALTKVTRGMGAPSKARNGFLSHVSGYKTKGTQILGVQGTLCPGHLS